MGLLRPSALAQTIWTEPTTGSWFDGNNWSVGLPNSSTDADIDNGGIAVIDASGAAVRKLRIGVASVGELQVVGDPASLNSLETTLGETAGSTATVVLTGPNATWTNTSDHFVVGQGGEADLTISAGAVLTSGTIADTISAVLGAEVDSHGTVTVTGAGSNWTVASGLTIGGEGSGDLTIAAGATASNAGHPSYVAESTNSLGTLLITGKGSIFSVEKLNLGYGGHGSLTIEKEGRLQGGVVAGYLVGSLGTIVVDGKDSTLTATSGLPLGVGGKGELSVTNGGTVTSGPLSTLLGNLADSSGSATVDGAGSKWNLNSHIIIGGSGSGVLTVSDGGQVTDTQADNSALASGVIGSSLGGSGLVLVTGAGSNFTVGSQLLIGADGSGELQIKQGGSVANQEAIAGLSENATAAITVQAASWHSSAQVRIAVHGKATLLVTDGSQMTSGSGLIAVQAGSVGTATISASTWSIEGAMVVGVAGSGSLSILDGAVVSSTSGLIGRESSPGHSTVSIVGPGSAWLNSGSLSMGVQGGAALDVSNGAHVTSSGASIGTESSAGARFSLTGAGTTYINSGTMDVGGLLSGQFEVLDGATATSELSRLGLRTDEVGTALVTGAGSKWTSSRSLTVGDRGNAQLTVADGASVVSVGGAIGSQANAVGQVNVTGANSVWTNSQSMTIGDLGTGQLSVTGGGKVTSLDASLGVRTGASGNAIVQGPGSDWSITGLLTVGFFGTSQLTIADGGRVGASSAFCFGQNGVQIQSGGTLEIADFLMQGLSVNQGRFVGNMLVLQGGQFSGSGEFDGLLTVFDGGSFSPGASPGTALTPNTVWDTEGIYRWEINAIDEFGGAEGQTLGWDLWQTGELTVNDSFKINIVSLGLDDTSGPLTHWNAFATHQWRIATADGPAFLSLDKLILDADGFLNPLEGGKLWLSASTDGMSLFVNFSPVPEPSTIALTAIGILALAATAAGRRFA